MSRYAKLRVVHNKQVEFYFDGSFSDLTDITAIKLSSGSNNNTIGTDIAKRRNVFLVTGDGVEIVFGSNNIISSNYFGTRNGNFWPGPPGSYGIRSGGSGNQITNNLIVGYDKASWRVDKTEY